MSVYKPKGSEIYVYDFWRGGNRFSGSTGAKSKREAEQVERDKKDEAVQASKARKAMQEGPMTLDVACDRYWIEVGQHAKSAKQIESHMDYLLRQLGEKKLIREITDDDVSALVAKRRGERVDNFMKRKHAGKRGGARKPSKLVTPSTVNRTVTEPLRRIMRCAQNKWKKEVGLVDWAQHRLKEPNERVRSMSAEEEDRLFVELPAKYHAIVRFAFKTGCRAMECINLRWSDINWGDREITILGKGDKTATIPMALDVRDMLFPLQQVGAEYVFTQPNGAGRITYRGFYAAFRTATKRAGIVGLRLHDLRHTAATRLLRSTGNLRLAKDLLRHEDVSTTSKYAHATTRDLRDALDAMATQKVPCEVPEAPAKSLKDKQ